MNDSEKDFKTHYFDWAATSPADEDILRQAVELTLKDWGNPSSSHQVGKNARTLLEAARERAVKAFGVPSSTVYFTSGGTESDQIPLLAQLAYTLQAVLLFFSAFPLQRRAGRTVPRSGQRCAPAPGWVGQGSQDSLQYLV